MKRLLFVARIAAAVVTDAPAAAAVPNANDAARSLTAWTDGNATFLPGRMHHAIDEAGDVDAEAVDEVGLEGEGDLRVEEGGADSDVLEGSEDFASQ